MSENVLPRIDPDLVVLVYAVRAERTHFGVTSTYWLADNRVWRVYWWDRKLYLDPAQARGDGKSALARIPLGDHTLTLVEIRRGVLYERVLETFT